MVPVIPAPLCAVAVNAFPSIPGKENGALSVVPVIGVTPSSNFTSGSLVVSVLIFITSELNPCSSFTLTAYDVAGPSTLTSVFKRSTQASDESSSSAGLIFCTALAAKRFSPVAKSVLLELKVSGISTGVPPFTVTLSVLISLCKRCPPIIVSMSFTRNKST